MKSDIEKREELFKLNLKEPLEENMQYINRLDLLLSLDSEKLKGNILVNSIEQA